MGNIRDKQVELEQTVAGYKDNLPDAEKRQLFMEEMIFPILESLRSIKSIGSKVIISDKVMESSVYMQLR